MTFISFLYLFDIFPNFPQWTCVASMSKLRFCRGSSMPHVGARPHVEAKHMVVESQHLSSQLRSAAVQGLMTVDG